jgi:hypothetical protein
VTVFGQIITGFDVETAVEETLDMWLPTYLREMERQKAVPVDALRPIASTLVVNEFSQYQGEPLPCAVIVCPGTEGEPERVDDGVYNAWWTVGVGVLVEAVSEQAARKLAQLYAFAIAALLVQHPSLGGFASRTRLGVVTGEDAPGDFQKAGCAVARVVFSVLTEGVVTALAGPSAPDPDPNEWPQVATVHIDAERLTS